ncbi:MAG: fibronectin type III domain-containing protein, partial [Planctomycetota bacterium]
MRRKRTFRPVVESLESRRMLAGNGLVEVGAQPVGALTGKIVYAHAGHGWTADNLGSGAWTTQRPVTFEMVEDLGNQDQTPFFAEYLFNAGATVAALRPIGHQPNEVVLDNDDPEVTFVGSWTDSGASVYFGAPSDVPYRFATKSVTETAYARYRPNITTAGFYPVYTWATSGANRVDDQLYRVNHSGGITEVTVNHQQVGGGTVYLGTYYFDVGTDGYVDVSNRSQSSGGSVVVADMIRFGNGMGDINQGGGVSGKPREDESGLYWVKWHVDRSQGISDTEYRVSSSDRTAAVTFSPRYAEYMNNASVGPLSDRVFVSFHSNAGGGNARGVLGLYNGNNNPSSATPNQFELANIVAREVNDDLVDQAGQFEFDWFDRGSSVTLDRSDIEFGEINNAYAQNEFDATIIETGFHDNTLDALMLRDAKVRDALGRATYQGVVKYFNFVDGGATPVVMLPGTVSNLHTEVVDTDSVEVRWDGPTANTYDGDAATGYRVYVSTDGYGFDGGRFVPVTGGTESLVIDGLDSGDVYYFKVTAVNSGGESPGSEVLAARPGADARVLVVNGFDRLGRSLNPREAYSTTEIDRVKQRFSNSFDYSVQVGEALEVYGQDLQVAGTSNESVINGDVVLADYDAVVWITGEESSADDTFNLTEQMLVSDFLANGGRLFVTGAEIGWDLDNLNNGRSFYENQLRANYSADDANTYSVQGTAGGIFAGLSFDFDDGTLFYDSQFPDVMTPNNGSTAALSYVGGLGGTAAVQYTHPDGYGQLVNFGFPFETITTPILRAVVMQRVLDFFALPSVSGDFDGNGLYECSDVDSLVAAIVDVKGGSLPDLAFDLTGDGDVTNDDLDAWLVEAGAAGLTGSGDPVLVGDANLDGVVDGQDFIAWNTHKFSVTGAWCQADFDANGLTEGQDFILWNNNKFTSANDVNLTAPLDPTGSTPTEGASTHHEPAVVDALFAGAPRGVRGGERMQITPAPPALR